MAEESGVFKALKLVGRIDWRSMVLIITALTGALGFVWNKVELYVQQYRSTEIEQVARTTDAAAGGAYDALATRIDELFQKVEALEKKARIKTEYTPVSPDAALPPPVPVPSPVSPDSIGKLMDAPPEPVSKRFQRARLPEFQDVQQAAQAPKGDLKEFITEVKSR